MCPHPHMGGAHTAYCCAWREHDDTALHYVPHVPPTPDGIGEPFFRDASSSFLVQVEALLSYDMKGALRDAAASGRQPTMDLAGAVGECRTYGSAHDDSSCCIVHVE